MERSTLRKAISSRSALIVGILLIPMIAIANVRFDKLDVDNIELDANTISTTNSNGDLTFDMNGTGRLIMTDLTASTVPYLDASKKLISSAVTPTELGYLSGATSSLQTQISNISGAVLTVGTFGSSPTANAANIATNVLTIQPADATHPGAIGTGAQTLSGPYTAAGFVGPLTGAVTGNASTATALAANPADCASDTYATTIAASGALTCASITNASTTAVSTSTNSTIVLRDGSGDFAAHIITAAVAGNATTATALAANPSACASGEYVSDIAANGTLTCSQPSGALSGLTDNRIIRANGTTAVENSAATIDDAGGVTGVTAISIASPSAGAQGTLKIYEASGNGTNYILIAPSATLSGDFALEVPGINDVLVTRTNTETLTNKTLTTPAIDVPLFTQAATPSTPAAGKDKLYFKSDDLLYSINSAGTEVPIGSAGSGTGTREYISNTGAEYTTIGWSTYADAAAATPADGTGGTATGLTLSRTTTGGEVIRQTASFKLAKDAANRQGDGISTDIALDPIDYNVSKPIYISFDYQTTANYAASDIIVNVYDIDGTALVNVRDSNGLNGALPASTNNGRFTGVFYSVATHNDYRIIAHIATTNAGAYDFTWDNVHVGGNALVPGAIVADLGTETWADSQANSTTTVRLTRFGNRVIAKGTTVFTGAMSGAFTVTIPAAYTPDATEYDITTKRFHFGGAVLRDTGTGFYNGEAWYNAANTIEIYDTIVSATYAQPNSVAATTPHTWATTDTITFEAEWIVSGWTTGAQFSTTENLFQTVRAVYKLTASNANTAFASNATEIIDFDTKVFDNFSAVTVGASWHFTAPKAAWYKVNAFAAWANTTTMTRGRMDIYKGGVFQQRIFDGGINIGMSGSPYKILLAQGDTLDLRLIQNDSGAGARNVDTTSDLNFISIEEDPNFSIFSVYGQTELVTGSVLSGSAVSFTSPTSKTITSIVISPGEWDISGTCGFLFGGNGTRAVCGIGTVTNTLPSEPWIGGYAQATYVSGAVSNQVLATAPVNMTVTASTTIYLVGQCTFSSSTCTGFGGISARRIK